MTILAGRLAVSAHEHLETIGYYEAETVPMKGWFTKRVVGVRPVDIPTTMSDERTRPPAADESVRSMVVDLEREAGLTLSPIERLFLSTDGTVTHMLEALTRREVSIDILHREVTGNRLYRTVALECDSGRTPLVWARSTIRLSPLEESIADELVDGDIGIGHVLREECAETRRTIAEVNARFDGEGFPSFVESDAACLLERTYRIHAASAHIMTITEFFPKDGLSRYRTR